MTKEELEKEIKNYIDMNCNQWETDGLTVDDIVRIAVLDFAEPREKQIQIDAEQIRALQKDKGDLIDENKVLTQNLEDTEIINAELKNKLKEKLKTIADKDLSFVARFDALEKENAELKSIANFQQSGNMSRYFELKRQAEKLEEAKELLKQWLSLCGFKVEKLSKDTEQFLNSEIEK